MSRRLSRMMLVGSLFVSGGYLFAQGVPAPPTALQGSVSGSTVTLTWTAPAGSVPVSYAIEVGSAPGLANLVTLNTGAASTTFTAANAPAGTYFIRVRAQGVAGLGATSNEVSITVGGAAPCVAPSPPANVTATSTGGLVTIAWTAVSGATAYVVEAGASPGGANLAVLEVGGTSFTASAPNGTYYIRVRGRNACGTSGASNEATLIVGPPSPGGAGLPRLEIVPGTVAIVDTAAGNARILGEVRNVGTGIAAWAEVMAILRGPSGAVVGTEDWFVDGRTRRLVRTGFVTDTTLAPGEAGCFAMLTAVPRSQVSTVDLTTGFDTAPTEATGGRAEIDGNVSLTAPGGGIFGVRASGQIRNVGARLIYFVQAVLDMKDANGRLVECLTWFIDGRNVPLRSGVTTGTGLLPGEAGPFGALSRARLADVRTSSSWAIWDEGSALSGDPTIQRFDADMAVDTAVFPSDAEAVETWARARNDRRARARALDRAPQ